MKLPKFIVLSALFCLSHSQEPTEYVDVTSSMSSFQARYQDTPDVVTIRNHVYAVFLQKDSSFLGVHTAKLTLTSLDGGNRRQSCNLSVPLDSDTGLAVKKVVALGNGKIVIASNHQMASGREWIYHIIIDPFDCSTERTVKFPYTIDYEIATQPIALVPYYDSYDIFYGYITDNSTGLPNNPYRYNDEGQRIELNYHLETQPNYYYRFQINTIKPHDASGGYYHSYFDKRTEEIVLQRLDSRFQKVKEARVEDDRLFTATDVSTTQGHISYCSLKIENPFCNLLNADLEVQFTSELPKFNFPRQLSYFYEPKVMNLPNNKGLVVLLAYEHPEDNSYVSLRDRYDFYLQWVGSDGSVAKTRKIESAVIRSREHFAVVNSSKDFCHVTISPDSYWQGTMYSRCLDL